MSLNILKISDPELEEISRKHTLSLTLEEMRKVQGYFRRKNREPTLTELECIAQTWSEHCKHKTMTGSVDYTENSENKSYSNLLKETVFAPIKDMETSHCLSIFKDNAGIIRFTPGWAIAIKAETHNHPSAIEPYGGASTGIGGVIRDILGAGLGAKPVLNIDVFCFGLQDTPHNQLPPQVLHPMRVFRGVVKGVRDYSNRMGIPTSSGAIVFDPGYTCNPLVYCGTVGIIPENCVEKKVRPGDTILLIGGKTGRDGLHGATFSSSGLDNETDSSCVQIGDPITEKKVADILLRLRDQGLYNAVTDCGAGGLSSAVGEMGADTGAVVNLEKVPLKQRKMEAWEIFLSESQERMVLSVPEEKMERISSLLESEDVEYASIGTFKGGSLKVFYNGEPRADLDMDFLHRGYPGISRRAVWEYRKPETLSVLKGDPQQALFEILADPNIGSREKVIRQYDHEVQGTAVIRPLEGMSQDIPQDGCVIRPILEEKAGIAVGLGINPFYGRQDPRRMAASVTEEAVRNAVSCGGDIRRGALMDNFCWGDTSDQKELGGLVRACQGCGEASRILQIPFISGKDSLNNFYTSSGGKKINIPGTLLVTCVAPVKDVNLSCRSSFVSSGNFIYLAGDTFREMGHSALARAGFCSGGEVPGLREETSPITLEFIRKSISLGVLESCHDLSEGGLAIAAAEMCFSGTGADIDISLLSIKDGADEHNSWIKLFSESNSRFLVEVTPENAPRVESLSGASLTRLGVTDDSGCLLIRNGRDTIIRENSGKLKEIHRGALKW